MNHTIPSLYQPATGWFGDVMPIFANGEFHLFYTYLDRSDTGDPETFKGLDWAHLSTTDFLTFREHATAIGRGSKDAADLLVGAGSVLDTGDGFVAYYCGINPRRLSVGEPEQVVLRAISDDLHTWRKDETFEFRSDPQWYERDAWRDPFVYRDGDGWRMLLCARSNTGPVDRRGVVGLARSDDLDTWTATAPFLQMGTTYAPECIETFTQDGREYLVYSSYSDRFQTRYRMKSETGHFERATQDALESNDVYAMKTVAASDQRYLVGWLSSRADDRDTGHRQWGGSLVAHTLHVRPDGSLGVAPVDGFFERFHLAPAPVTPRQGTWSSAPDGTWATTATPFSWASVGDSVDGSALDVTIDLDSSAAEFGIAIHAGDSFDHAYLLRIEPDKERVVFDRRPHPIGSPFDYSSDRAYVSAPDHEIERPLVAADGRLRIRVAVLGSAIVTYLNDVALTTRGYDLRDGMFAMYAADGHTRFIAPHYGCSK